ncbi:MAG: spore maturation protein [Clostridia bacterium]|nr:spore maturation protein [Clostridia bacterium]
MSKYILPIFILLVIVIAFIKKVPVYDNFVKGSKESLSIVLSIFPYICAVLVAVELFSLSGLNAYFAKIMSPVLTFLGIPEELCELLIIRPLSGNGSLALLEDIYKTHGADAYISRCASVIVGASETVFYVGTVYFSTTKVKKLRYAIPISLVACYFGAIMACVLCKFI